MDPAFSPSLCCHALFVCYISSTLKFRGRRIMPLDCRKHLSAGAVLIILFMLIGAGAAFGGDPATVAGSGGSVWGADYFPNIPLVTQEGKKVRFFSDLIKNKV